MATHLTCLSSSNILRDLWLPHNVLLVWTGTAEMQQFISWKKLETEVQQFASREKGEKLKAKLPQLASCNKLEVDTPKNSSRRLQHGFTRSGVLHPIISNMFGD